MKLNALLVIEILIFSGFWFLVITGQFNEFETIAFFEPEFTYALIAMSILTGMLIGGLVERWQQETHGGVKE